jgi:hypothetical protein
MTTPQHQERFQALLDEHKRILYKVCHSYCRNRDDREDLAQEIILQSGEKPATESRAIEPDKAKASRVRVAVAEDLLGIRGGNVAGNRGRAREFCR